MIDIKQLDFGYGSETLFSHLDMSLAPGNIYGLLGLNGAGKSTLLKLMTGLLFPTTGNIEALGATPAERKPSFLREVFVLPEELNLPGITGEEYLAGLAPFYPRFDHARFERYLVEFELPKAKKLTSHSFGQKKKFLLSFGLASGTSLLVLDEPTNGLDIPSKSMFRRLVAEAATDDRLFVISTHQVKDVESLIDPIVILHSGQVLFNQTMSAITSRIRMAHRASSPEPIGGDVIYSEPAVGGSWTVWAEADEDGRIDLEVLFNSVIAAKDRFGDLFSHEGASR
jgi:ABC-2 type transport system ATP-binding protein